jgi:hypothetical protein
MLPSLRKFNHSEVAQERLKIIQFYDEQGEAKTKKYFGVNRKRSGPGSTSSSPRAVSSRR